MVLAGQLARWLGSPGSRSGLSFRACDLPAVQVLAVAAGSVEGLACLLLFGKDRLALTAGCRSCFADSQGAVVSGLIVDPRLSVTIVGDYSPNPLVGNSIRCLESWHRMAIKPAKTCLPQRPAAKGHLPQKQTETSRPLTQCCRAVDRRLVPLLLDRRRAARCSSAFCGRRSVPTATLRQLTPCKQMLVIRHNWPT